MSKVQVETLAPMTLSELLVKSGAGCAALVDGWGSEFSDMGKFQFGSPLRTSCSLIENKVQKHVGRKNNRDADSSNPMLAQGLCRDADHFISTGVIVLHLRSLADLFPELLLLIAGIYVA